MFGELWVKVMIITKAKLSQNRAFDREVPVELFLGECCTMNSKVTSFTFSSVLKVPKSFVAIDPENTVPTFLSCYS